MVFLNGFRQMNKTTLVRSIQDWDYPAGSYFNWDYGDDRQSIRQKKWMDDSPLLVFDELHKYPGWKNRIKGIYDVNLKLMLIMLLLIHE